MSEVKIPEGYKQTEVGVIPEDWRIATIEDIAIFRNGVAHEKFIDANGKYIAVNSKFISTEAKVIKRTKVLRNPAYKNEILMVMSDVPNGRAIAKCFLVPDNSVYSINQRICALNIIKDNPKYIFYQINRNPYYLAFDDGVKQTNLRRQDVLDCPLMIPPKQEQNAIATALSDINNLIQSLEKLIAKKEAIKTGTMQQLLTGKTRLPDFATREDGSPKGFKQTELGQIPEDWKVGTLSELSSYINDGTHYTPSYVQNGVPFYSVENVTANDFINVKNISLEEHNRLIKRCKPERGDILMTRIGSLGKTRIIDWDVDASIYVSLALIKPSNTIKSQYMYEFSKSNLFQKEVEKRSLVNATPQKINMAEIGQVQICYPKNKNEQTAIATILSDMDAEIQTLQQRLEKTKDIKQGMMQQLLTGKVRLAH